MTLDDVMLYESVYPALLTLTDSGEFVDGSFATTPAVLPGETQNAAYQDITETGFWYMYDGSWSGAAATYGVTGGKFEIDVTNVAGEVWHFMLKQKGIELVKNTLYTLSFTAFASVDRPISVGFNPGLLPQVVNLTTTAKTYEISFYYTGDTLETRIEFLFGGAVGKVTLDDVVLLQVASEEVVVPVLDKLVAPVNGLNHTIATNHVGIGPYDGGAGYNGQLRFVWFEKGTENVKGSDLFTAPAGIGYAYIYTEFLKTLPAGTYTVKFQAVGDQLLASDSDFSIHTFEVTKAAPAPEATYVDTNEFVDGTFTTTTTITPEVQTGGADTTGIGFWYSYVADWGGAVATFSVVNGALEVNITNSFNQIWGVMLKQKGIDLVQNTSYRLSFTASSTVARDIRVGFNPGSEQKLFAITTTPTTYTFDFVYTGGNVQARIEFLLGTGPVSKITLDNVALLKAQEPEGPAPVAVKLAAPVNGLNHTIATNHVGIGPYAGGTGYNNQLRFVWFEKGTETIKGSDLFTAPANVGYAYIYTEFLKTLSEGTYTVKFQAVGDQTLGLDSDFSIHTFEVIKAAPVTTPTKLAAPVNGLNHTIATNHVGIGPYAGGTGYNNQLRFVWFEKGTETIKGSDLFNAPANVGYAYIYTEFLKTLPNGVYTVKFQAVGDQALGLDSDFSIHTFEVTKAAPVVLTYQDSNEFVDGTFTTTTTITPEVQTGGADTTGIGFWYSYVADWGGAVATFSVVNGALEVNITNSFNQIWGVMLKQKGIDLVQNTSYRLSFTASSTVARDIRVGFAPGSEQKLFSLTTTPTTYTFDFVYTGGNVQTRIEFLLGTGVASTITLDNVALLIGTPSAD